MATTTNQSLFNDQQLIFQTANDDRKISFGSATGTTEGIEIEYDRLTTPKTFKITPLGVNWNDGVNNYTTGLERLALVQQAFQAVELPPNATTLEVNSKVALDDQLGNVGSIGLNGVNTEITATGDLLLNPTGTIDANGKTLNMTAGEIHNCPLVHSQNNNDITIEGKGTGDVILKTGNTNRLGISDTGAWTINGSVGTSGQVLTSQGSTLPPIWSGYTARITATGGDSVVDFYENGLLYRCHRFTTTGAYTLNVSTISANALFDFCIIGGGGGGGGGFVAGSGAGAGCIIVGYNVPFTTLGNITGSVGAGGSGGSNSGIAGGNSTIVLPSPSSITITANGGGAGRASGFNNGSSSFTNTFLTPFNITLGSSASGCGGASGTTGGTTTGLTNAFPKSSFSDLIWGGGRNGGSNNVNVSAGGGGGSGGDGGNGSANGGAGGIGVNLVFDGTLRQVCGGGGGGSVNTGGGGIASFGGGNGGGGAGSAGSVGSANTGGGGGGGGNSGSIGGNGGSGLVMIRYVIG